MWLASLTSSYAAGTFGRVLKHATVRRIGEVLLIFSGFFIASLFDCNLLLGMEPQPHTFHPFKHPKEI
jgi:hypothetical protein